MYSQSKVDEAVSAVRRIATGSLVLKVSEHFAGYFDELGITISLDGSASVDEIRDLKNRVAPELIQMKMPFQWMVLFEKDGKSAGVLFPDGLFTGPSESSRVALVLEPENDQLEAMANMMPVWAVDSPVNRSLTEQFWHKFRNANQNDVGITLFRTQDIEDRYNNFVGILDTVEEHHWGLRQLYVLGLELSEQTREDLLVLGFNTCSPTENGFVAMKQT
jgi:hypothetical protein